MTATGTKHSTQLYDTTMFSLQATQPPGKSGHTVSMPFAAKPLEMPVHNEVYENDMDADPEEPIFYSEYRNGTMSTFAETFSYSSEHSGGQRHRMPDQSKHLKGRTKASKIPMPPLVDIPPKTQTRKSPLYYGSSARYCSPSRFRSDPLSVTTSSSDSWDDSIIAPKEMDASREVSLLDMAESRDDEEESESDGDYEEHRDEIEEHMFNYNQVDSRSFYNDSPRDGTFSIPKLAQGPCSHLRDSSKKDGSKWMKRLYKEGGRHQSSAEERESCINEQFLYSEEQLEQQRSSPAKGPCSHLRKNDTSKWMERFYPKEAKVQNKLDEQDRESCVTEQQFLYSAEKLEKQKSTTSLNSRSDLLKQGSSLLTPLTTLFNSLSCTSQSIDKVKKDAK